jgi:flagella basal body P-ring formation protein FlgA
MVALEDLRPGVPIRPEQVAIQSLEGFPDARVTPSDLAKVTGALPRRFINANTPVWEDSIDPPNLITKGDRVSVTVNSGLARLSFDADAESSGRLGEMVSFKNPDSGRFFRARVDGPDEASVDTPGRKP